MTLTLRYAARSDRGLIRDGNQDSVYAGPRLLAVADGMGGMAAGDVASNIVIGAMAPLDEDVPGDALGRRAAHGRRDRQPADPRHRRRQPANGGHGHHADRHAVLAAARSAWCTSATRAPTCCATASSPRSPRTTPTSRCWSTRAGSAPEEASSHPQRSLLTRALDGRDIDPEYSVRQVLARRPVPDLQRRPVRRGQRRDDRATRCASTPTRSSAPSGWSQLALRGGGPDNITVIVADVTDEDIVEAAPIVGGAAARDRGHDDLGRRRRRPAARASAALTPPRAAAPGAGAGHADGRDDEPERPRRHPVRTARSCCACCSALLGGGLWAGWTLHPVAVLRRRHRRRAGRGLPGRPGRDRRPRPVQRALDQQHRASTS